jgi:predicted Fe-S protein YdhL (DUF1289 family)
MYADPSLIREHVVKLSFNDREADLINAWVAYTGQQKAAFLREMLLEQARLDLEATMGLNEAPQQQLFGN